MAVYGNIAAPAILLSFSFVALSLRCWVKKKMLNNFSVDDWILVAAMLFYIVFVTMAMYAATDDRTSADMTPDQIRFFFKMTYFQEINYYLTGLLVKLSVALLLLRLTVQPIQRKILWTTIVYFTIQSLAGTLCVVFQCWPIGKYWNRDKPGSCFDTNLTAGLALFGSVNGAIADTIYAIIPAWIFWSICMSRNVRAAIFFLIILGLIASSVSFVRFKFVIGFTLKAPKQLQEFTGTLNELELLSIIECGLGIFTASLASIKPMLSLLKNKCGFYSTSPIVSYTSSKQRIANPKARISNSHKAQGYEKYERSIAGSQRIEVVESREYSPGDCNV